MNPQPNPRCEGILLLDKPKGKTAFDMVALLRRKLHVKTIGHAGTLDPMATGVMVMLIGKKYTTLSDRFLSADKEYVGRIRLGIETDTYDAEGMTQATSDLEPTKNEIVCALAKFQGRILQVPPMFSAKKINGQKLYHLARQGKSVERPPQEVNVEIELIDYTYPFIDIRIACSKGTYIRSIAHDLGRLLQCGAHLAALVRTRSGSYTLAECVSGEQIYNNEINDVELIDRLRKTDRD